MPYSSDDTTDCAQQQALLHDDWNQEIVARLPATLEQQARHLKAFERARKIRTATDLLRGLLASVLLTRSFRHLGMWSLKLGLADVSDTDWRHRLRKASPWLSWLLGELIAMPQALSPMMPRAGVRRILLIDGTHWKCPGLKGMVWRVHTAFDVLAGRLADIKVTDYHQAEQVDLFDVRPGDLLVTDRANGIRDRVVFVLRQAANMVVRISAHAFPMLDAQGQPMEVVRWLKHQRARAGRICSRQVFIEQDGHRYPLRLLALRLTTQQQERAQRRVKRKASKQQRHLQSDTLYLAGWVLVVTTLPQAEWSDAQILRLYQARWHIELLFKRIKQLLDTHVLRCSTPESVLPSVTALLIGWALLEEQSAAIRLVMQDAMHARQMAQQGVELSAHEAHSSWWNDEQYGPLSEWQLAVVSCDLLLEQIRGHISARRHRACLPRLQRFLCSGKRKRQQDIDLQRDWLTCGSAGHQQGP